MNKNEIVFKLSEKEKIVIELNDPITNSYCCYETPIFFVQGKKRIFLVNTNIKSAFNTFDIFLKKALKNKLKLHKSITQDIGFLYNEEAHGKPGFFYTQFNKVDYWIGNKNLLWSACVYYGNLQIWIYNDSKGSIILEIAPIYPYQFCNPKREPHFILYEEWMKSYKPFFIQTIPQEIAQAWLKQTQSILKQIENNIKK